MTTHPTTVEDLRCAGPTVSLWPTAGQALGISKSHTYKIARDGQFPAKVIKEAQLDERIETLSQQ